MEFEVLHRRALAIASKLRKNEFEMLTLLQEIDSCKGFTKLGYPSLFRYVAEELKLSEGCAYRMITVARMGKEIPPIMHSLFVEEFSVATAAVIAPVITIENCNEWIEKAVQLSRRELERAVAEANPQEAKKERARHQGNKQVRIEVTVSEVAWAFLERAKELLAQKRSMQMNLADTLHEVAEFYVKREDPVGKADRNAQNTPPGGSSLTKNRHLVRARDRGRCQFQMPGGKLCGERKWVDIHHIIPKAMGGSDEPANLVTLCAAHHRIVHKAAQREAAHFH